MRTDGGVCYVSPSVLPSGLVVSHKTLLFFPLSCTWTGMCVYPASCTKRGDTNSKAFKCTILKRPLLKYRFESQLPRGISCSTLSLYFTLLSRSIEPYENWKKKEDCTRVPRSANNFLETPTWIEHERVEVRVRDDVSKTRPWQVNMEHTLSSSICLFPLITIYTPTNAVCLCIS